MGGWLLCIPETSGNKDLAWELITLVLDPKNNDTFACKIQPAQIPIGEGPNSAQLKQTISYYDKLISMMTIARARPSISEYPHIAEDIHQAVDQVFYKVKNQSKR